MSTSTFIQAVPWEQQRARRAVALARQTEATVVWDQDHDAFATWRAVMRKIGQQPAVVLEDDVTLADRWRERVEESIALVPNDVIQFFSMRGRDLTVGSRWEPGRSFMMNQCYYLPAGVAHALWEYTSDWHERHPEEPTGYDIAMAEWMRFVGRKYWLHVPSLVQHEKWTSEIQPKRPRNRQSITFEEQSP